jgi:hypothetical protein
VQAESLCLTDKKTMLFLYSIMKTETKLSDLEEGCVYASSDGRLFLVLSIAGLQVKWLFMENNSISTIIYQNPKSTIGALKVVCD